MTPQVRQGTQLSLEHVVNSLRNQIADKSVLIAEREALIEVIGTENIELKEKLKGYEEIKKELEILRKEVKKHVKN